MNILPLGIGLTIFFAVALAASFFWTRSSRATTQRLREVTLIGGHRLERSPLARDFGQRLFGLVRSVRGRLGMADDVTLAERLGNAGYKDVLGADIYIAARILTPLLALVFGSFIPWNRTFWMFALPCVGYLVPDFILVRLVIRRREKIRLGIPDAVDLLVICVDAGLGIDQALLRVGQELGVSHPDITEELLQINREQRAGKPRIQAWVDMARRSALTDIDAFSTMLLQSERFGTPIARALSAFANNIRLKRRQAAEEMAAKTTVKIIFPLVLFIFPCIFIVLLAPPILNIMRGMPGN